MVYKKNIRIFLMDGDPYKRWSATIGNWNGIAYKIPRSCFPECKDDLQTALSNSGVYLLINEQDSQNQPIVYIGESENIYARISQHIKLDDSNNQPYKEWNEVVIITSLDAHLHKGHIRHLEKALYQLAISANRFQVKNQNQPTGANLLPADLAEMDEFLDNIKIIVATLGYKLLEDINHPLNYNNSPIDENTVYLRNATGSNWNKVAEGYITPKNQILLKAGAQLVPDNALAPSTSATTKANRQRYAPIIDSDHRLTEDILFASVSAAAEFVLGGSKKGKLYWFYAINDKSLKEVEEEL